MMYSTKNGNNPVGLQLNFSLWEVKGSWISREGAPSIRIYRDTSRRNGGYWMEFAYDERAVFHRLIKRDMRGLRYFDLYGFIGMAYDPRRDMLQLSAYGDYYRAED